MYRAVYGNEFGSWNLVASGSDVSDATAPMYAAGPEQYPTVEYTWDGAAWQTRTWNMGGVGARIGDLPPKPAVPLDVLPPCSTVPGLGRLSCYMSRFAQWVQSLFTPSQPSQAQVAITPGPVGPPAPPA